MKASAAPVALVPAGVVTVMSTVPALAAGAVAVICVALLGVKVAAGADPNLTDETPVNPVPPMTTDVPPAVVPLVGLIPVTVGTGGTYVKWSAFVTALVPPPVATVTSTVPAAPAGAVAVICVALLTAKAVAVAVPNLTADVPVNPVPVMTTDVPPVVLPLAGLIPATVGAGTGGT